MNVDNLPCPFCGGNVDPKGWLSDGGARGPECEDCGATAESIEVWNKREKITSNNSQSTPCLSCKHMFSELCHECVSNVFTLYETK